MRNRARERNRRAKPAERVLETGRGLSTTRSARFARRFFFALFPSKEPGPRLEGGRLLRFSVVGLDNQVVVEVTGGRKIKTAS